MDSNRIENEFDKIKEAIYTVFKKKGMNNIVNFHIGKLVEIPNQLGCIKQDENWYMYETDEKNFCTFSGPFSVQGIIYACALKLNIAADLEMYKFTEEEFNIFIDNHFHNFAEIREYEKRH